MMIQHEPGRCRRTDGKKWRCSKEVLPEQKYCESHIHRGRKCARKHSEAALDTTSSTKHPINVTNTITKLSESLSNPPHPPHVTPAATINTFVNYVKNNANGIDRKKDDNVESLFATSGQIFSLDDNNGDKRKRSENGYGDVKSSDCNNSVRNKLNLESMNKGDKSNANVAALIIGFPPRSNLHVGGTSLTGNTLLSEERRCRRTDGKKWRCSREVVTNKKYCVSHMHRGAKRIAATGLRGVKRIAASGLLRSNMFVVPLAVAKREEEQQQQGMFGVPLAVAKREEEDEVNTRLCISSATNLELIRRRSSFPSHSNGSSSDSTTITDEKGCLCP